MRHEPTEPEKRLWRALSGSQLGGHKFRRQAVIGFHICDFFCPAKNLAMEVDGDTHKHERDEARDAILQRRGVSVLHLSNEDVMKNMDGVLTMILATLEKSSDRWARLDTPHPNPSPEGEGLI
jgi:very-short-patch-repair endonuclease